MKKKWYGIIAGVMALLILASTAVPALAQSEEAVTVDSKPTLTAPKVLAIKAPRVTPVGKEVTMTVFRRGTQDPIEGAGIWALTRDEAEALKAEVTQMREESGIAAAQDQDYESLVSIHGTFLGRTDEDGQLKHTFDEVGWYLLVAVKKGYIPGFTPIGIRAIPKVLAIKAPRAAPVGKEVTMTVFQRLTQDPVEGAAIWALTRDEAEALKAEVTQMREEGSIAAGELDYESLVNVHGFRLGFTDEDGQLKHTFDEAGWYLLVAVKKGYIPGVKPICIGEIPHVLGLRVQWVALVSEEVTMTAFQRGTQELVEGAGIWALTREEAEVLREEWTAMRESGEVAPQEGDYESLVSIHGEFLGRTNGSGQLKHAFDEAGGYLLVVIKQGYRPGFNFIRVKPIPQANEAPDTLESTQ